MSSTRLGGRRGVARWAAVPALAVILAAMPGSLAAAAGDEGAGVRAPARIAGKGTESTGRRAGKAGGSESGKAAGRPAPKRPSGAAAGKAGGQRAPDRGVQRPARGAQPPARPTTPPGAQRTPRRPENPGGIFRGRSSGPSRPQREGRSSGSLGRGSTPRPDSGDLVRRLRELRSKRQPAPADAPRRLDRDPAVRHDADRGNGATVTPNRRPLGSASIDRFSSRGPGRGGAPQGDVRRGDRDDWRHGDRRGDGHLLGSLVGFLAHGIDCHCNSCKPRRRGWYNGVYCYGPWWYGWPASSITYYGGTTIEVVESLQQCPWTMAAAWDLLAEYRDEAYEAFGCLAEAMPRDGLAAIGLSLSAALLDRHEEAYAAMRRAIRLDPEAANFLPHDDRIQPLLTEAANHYEQQARISYGDLDALFMAAALRYMLGEQGAAYYAIDAAITLGDTDTAALQLKAMIME